MRKIIEVKELIINDRGLNINIENQVNIKECSEVGTMIADSDQNSLLYIIEENEEFVYISIPSRYWNVLKQALDEENPVFLQNEENSIQLNQWNDELSFIVQNVEGNLNYGAEFVEQIQNVFLEMK
jgi:hypothetical protein